MITGHSLGGALAVHCAIDVLAKNLKEGEDMKVYTYGQPRIGNYKFEDFLSNQVEEAYRIV